MSRRCGVSMRPQQSAVSDHPEVRSSLHETQPASTYTISAVFDRWSFSISLLGVHAGQLTNFLGLARLMLGRSRHKV